MNDIDRLLENMVPRGCRLVALGDATYHHLLASASGTLVKTLQRFPRAGECLPGQADLMVWIAPELAPAGSDLLGWSPSAQAPLLAIVPSQDANLVARSAAGAGARLAGKMEAGDFIACRFEPNVRHPVRRGSVLVVSCAGWENFGDRLGYHLLNRILPPGTVVHHAFFPALPSSAAGHDLLVLCLGTSMFHRLMTPQLFALLEEVPQSVGIFGTQYRRQIDRALMSDLIARLSRWFARSEEDLYLFGQSNSIHLGDWLIDCFPLSTPGKDEELVIGPDIMLEQVKLDRTIQHIQAYQRVLSARLHPLLCAFTSAYEVSYVEQREFGDGEPSGKFRSLLLDVFRRNFDERDRFPVDRDAVIRYKETVDRKIGELQRYILASLPVQPQAQEQPTRAVLQAL